ncbi:TetR/AcrR family transcriptional regulator [Symbioplanes lichenis]|uniref:TetR/AcrR family transcriptional regulator n=1 Tax=Symbioplanes lichenis TaxID=1629072 RepID=UPI002739920B|nr:TetR/AcrR family transcriptional regulator [Actinoplanes lichenis]
MTRGRPPAHTLERVIEAAIAVADADGLAAVTMRRIAGEIGAGAMSLYTYVPDKDRLVDAMVDRVGADVPAITPTGDWQGDLLAICRAQRASMLAHPWLPGALAARRITGRHMVAYLEQGLAALAPTRLDGSTKLEVIALLTGFVANFVANELAGPPTEEQVALIGEAVLSGDYPHLAAALAEGGSRVPTFDAIALRMIRGLADPVLWPGPDIL